MNMKQSIENKKSRIVKSHERVVNRTILLKTIFDEIVRDNKNTTLTTKKMRAKLRACRDEILRFHVHNSSWIFSYDEYVFVRSMFDEKFRIANERKTKRDAKKCVVNNDANDVNNVNNENNE